LAGEWGAVGKASGNGARVGLLDGNRATGASAGVDTSLNIDANVVVALEFLGAINSIRMLSVLLGTGFTNWKFLDSGTGA